MLSITHTPIAPPVRRRSGGVAPLVIGVVVQVVGFSINLEEPAG